jgi:protein-disulfide isomerase
MKLSLKQSSGCFMMKLLSPKYLILLIVCGILVAGTLPAALSYDVNVTPTPSSGKTATATPAPSIEITAEATAEATELPYANPYAHIPFSHTDDGAPVLGNPDAPITIIEFADFACPYCQRYEPTMQVFIDTYVATGRA